MKNKELFDKTIGILVKAYFNKTLVHGDSCGCAFGNLVFQHKDASSLKNMETTFDNWFGVAVFNERHPCGLRQIKSTGYSVREAAIIEAAFESVDADFDEDGYYGLMGVCDALMEIHEANETEIAEAKALFVTA